MIQLYLYLSAFLILCFYKTFQWTTETEEAWNEFWTHFCLFFNTFFFFTNALNHKKSWLAVEQQISKQYNWNSTEEQSGQLSAKWHGKPFTKRMIVIGVHLLCAAGQLFAHFDYMVTNWPLGTLDILATGCGCCSHDRDAG